MMISFYDRICEDMLRLWPKDTIVTYERHVSVLFYLAHTFSWQHFLFTRRGALAVLELHHVDLFIASIRSVYPPIF